MKSLADLKRTLTVGTTIDVVQHRYPRLVGERTVRKVQTARVCLTIPGEPDGDGSWLTWPKREHLTFNDDGTIVVMQDPAFGDPGAFMTFRVKGG